ncbi:MULTISPECIES: hypothetical protein [Streptomyces]|uniref:Uncharacterized protein n=1 Tax=Streptomyces xanthii TaxID=2768069 RepID=A0A7H1B6H6_9ACTN|nr:hypothetical protein [Streptomyces xanthii]QNS04331.1 hypothetical protein IAG42_12310 [Streptomyces xanthii]
MESMEVALFLVVAGAVVASAERATRKRQKVFRDTYGTYEGFRREVDEGRVRTVRRERGDVAAIKAVRDGHPSVSLRLAKRYVQEL